jgi:hypothetical protein
VRRNQIYADNLERQRAYQGRKRAKDAEAHAVAQAARRLVAVARVNGWVSMQMPEPDVLEHLADDLMTDFSAEKTAKVLLLSK